MRSRVLLPIGWLLGTALLRLAGPSPTELLRIDQVVRALPGAPEYALSQLASGLAWLLLLWLAVGWVAVRGAGVRGRPGRLCRGVVAVLVPRMVRGLLEGGVGLSVVLAATPALAAPASAATSTTAAASVTTPAPLPSLDRRPTTDVQLAPLPAVPAPLLARAGAPSSDPVVRGRLPASPAEVVVQRGDCLWDVVARTLGPGADDAAIARAWPRWYAANRSVIGTDPGLLLPGQRLVAPAPSS